MLAFPLTFQFSLESLPGSPRVKLIGPKDPKIVERSGLAFPWFELFRDSSF
jgi:hypothetical protein